MKPQVKITLDTNLDETNLEFFQGLEIYLDEAMLRAGYTRTVSTKGGGVIPASFTYRQFAAAL